MGQALGTNIYKLIPTPIKLFLFLTKFSTLVIFSVYFRYHNCGREKPVYIEHLREMKKCAMYAGVQCIQVLSNWRSGEIETKSRVIRAT